MHRFQLTSIMASYKSTTTTAVYSGCPNSLTWLETQRQKLYSENWVSRSPPPARQRPDEWILEGRGRREGEWTQGNIHQAWTPPTQAAQKRFLKGQKDRRARQSGPRKVPTWFVILTIISAPERTKESFFFLLLLLFRPTRRPTAAAAANIWTARPLSAKRRRRERGEEQWQSRTAADRLIALLYCLKWPRWKKSAAAQGFRKKVRIQLAEYWPVQGYVLTQLVTDLS